jgi:copper transport protein
VWILFKFKQRFISIFLIFAFFFGIGVNVAESHSFVVEITPTPNSQLKSSPQEVKITFGDKIDKNLASITVTNDKQKTVTSESVQLSENNKEVRLKLPKLTSGIYKVDYYVISSNDGHPMRGSYSFEILNSASSQQGDKHGKETEAISPQQKDDEKSMSQNSDPHDQMGNESNNIQPQKTDQSKVNLTELFIYLMRAVYYLGLLLLIGWVFWWNFVHNYSTEFKKKYLFWGIIIQMLHLIGLISMILNQLNVFESRGLISTSDFSFESHFGLMWLVSLVLSLIGFACLFRNKWLDFLWIFIIILAKVLNGHSLEFKPAILLVISNFIHLFAASIWAAGLLFIIIYWRKQRLYVQSFLPLFSLYALLSIIILSITGIFTTVFFLSSADQLFTNWGLFLLVKLLVVIFVFIIGGLIRLKLKKHKTANLGLLVKIDFILMTIIVFLVSIITYLNPLL